MRTLNQLTQSHLSVLVLDRDSHNPIVRMPIYAELSIVEEAPSYEISRDDLGEIDGNQDIAGFLDEVLRSSLAQYIEENIFQAWNEEKKRAFLKLVINILEGEEDPFPDSESQKKEIVDRAILKAMEEFGIAQSQTPNKKSIYSYPLGYLATDHVGYASFDLSRISDLTRSQNNDLAAFARNGAQKSYAFFVYPMGKEGTRFDALEQGRFTSEAVFAKLSIERPTLTRDLKILNLPSMQKPSLIDWYFSPGSFAAHPEFLVGDDGCERLFPAQIALQEFNIRQVVRIAGQPPIALPEGYKFAYVDDYKVTWHSLGHSLGEILYSLPLAPGESAKLAVIDWSWESATQRTEQTALTEEVLHQTHRDRTISETVKAGLRELQKGSSFMGGVATSAGGSGSTGAIGVAIGNAWSLGGSTATSEGSRNLTAENVQRLSDSFSQASSAQRELNSTVVIQARQEEKESIQTRTFTNYNHSHTLTILYYEILRHFKVEVAWVRRRQAVLVKIPTQVTALDEAALIKNRFLLEPVLLNPALKSGFDALEKREAIANHQKIHGINLTTAVPEPWWKGDVELELFELGLRSPDDTVNPIVVYIITAGDHANSKRLELHYVYKGLNNEDIEYDAYNINSGTRMERTMNENTNEYWTFLKLQGQPLDGESKRIKWKDVLGFQFEKWGDTEWRIDALAIRGWDRFGFTVNFTEGEGLVPVNLFVKGKEPGSQTFSKIKHPGLKPALPAPVLSPEKSLSAEEAYQIKKLNDHFDLHKDYYNQIICLNKDPNTIAIEFESHDWNGTSKLIDHAEPYPLEAFGSYIAYPLIDANNQLPELNLEGLKKYAEKLITLPTRGVFAEGKLGHCNISEEIDNTRFWKWEEHPIPFEAPDINPVTPVTPQPQQTNITPTAFPSSLVNIVNPSAAPDPSGLAAALTLLGTPNIFRDMSGQQEVADLLKKLSDNTISIAEAANKARAIQSKSGGGGGSAGGTSSTIGGGSNGSEVPRLRPNQPSNANQDLHDAQHIFRRAQEQGLMTPEVSRDMYESMARERLTPQDAHAREEQVTNISSNITDVSVWLDLINFVPPSSVTSALNARNIKVQSIYDGMGDLNVDFYAVRIKKMPSQGGNLMSQEQLLNHIRTNFNNFIDTSNSSFSPLEPMDGPKWLSNDPIGAVLKIDIFGPDNAAVVASEYSTNHWRFCTVETPFSQTGSHPVSGTREWGIRPSGGDYMFYTRGADRATKILETIFGELATFPGADRLWRSLQTKVADFINQNQGEADILSPYSQRHSWGAVRTLYKLSPPQQFA